MNYSSEKQTAKDALARLARCEGVIKLNLNSIGLTCSRFL